MSYREVMRAIGSKTPTVKRNYIAYNILQQIEDVEELDVGPVESRFSVLFLSLREVGVRAFLGVDLDLEPAGQRSRSRGTSIWPISSTSSSGSSERTRFLRSSRIRASLRSSLGYLKAPTLSSI